MQKKLSPLPLFIVMLLVIEAIIGVVWYTLHPALIEHWHSFVTLAVINVIMVSLLWLLFWYFYRRAVFSQLLLSIKDKKFESKDNTVDSLKHQIQQHYDEKSLMLTALAHDIRTPLTEALLRIELLDDQETMIELKTNLENINRIVISSLEYAKESDELKTIKVDLVSLVDNLIEQQQQDDFELNFHSDFDSYEINIEVALFQRMLANLIENAKKYATCCHIRLRAKQGHLALCCEDDGPGVPDDFLELLSVPYFRVDQSRSDITGSGLGLAIVKKIAQLHHASLEVENLSGAGFRVMIIFERELIDAT